MQRILGCSFQKVSSNHISFLSPIISEFPDKSDMPDLPGSTGPDDDSQSGNEALYIEVNTKVIHIS